MATARKDSFRSVVVGAQNRDHHFAGLEERSTFRRRTSETTSSLSIE
jgi:hypothetical protein